MTAYSDKQREYWHKRPSDQVVYDTVDFYHPDFGHKRLVANQLFDKVLNGDSYQAVEMKVPQATNQTSDTTNAGSIQFGRIGVFMRKALLQITPFGAIKYSIEVTLRKFQKGIDAPIYSKRLFVDKDGISIGSDSVTVKLSVDNPSKLTNKKAFYDPSEFKGLQSL